MTTAEFSVNPSQFCRPPKDLFAQMEENKKGRDYFQKVEKFRYFFSDGLDEEIEKYQSEGSRLTKFLNTVNKVLIVFSLILSTLIPLGFYFLPWWVPIAVGIPATLFVSYVQGEVEMIARDRKQQAEDFQPFLKEFVKSHSLKRLHPFGEWDLLGPDTTLRADHVAEEELKKVYPHSALDLEVGFGLKSVGAADFGSEDEKKSYTRIPHEADFTPYAYTYAAHLFAQDSKIQDKWDRFKTAQANARDELLQAKPREPGGNFESAVKASKKADQIAYWDKSLDGTPRHPQLSFSPSLVRETETLVGMYTSFCNSFPHIEELYNRAVELYKPYPFLEQRKGSFHSSWDEYVTLARGIKGDVSPLIDLLTASDTKEVDFLSKIKEAKEKHLEFQLRKLLREGPEIERKLKNWIENHPENQLKKFEEKLKKWNSKTLSRDQLKEFQSWLKRYPQAREKKITSLPEGLLPKDIRAWIKARPRFSNNTPLEVYESIYKVRKGLTEATAALKSLQELAPSISQSAEQYDDYIEVLSLFQCEILSPIKPSLKSISTSKNDSVAKLAKGHIPLIKREDVPKEHSPLRSRLFEAFHLSTRLQEIDSKMVWTNRANTFGVKIPLMLLLAIEGIASLYISATWFYLGFSLLSLAGEGASLYIKHRLGKLEEEKQANKLQRISYNRPDIGPIPGNRPGLAHLKQVQQRYHLDGVSSTQAAELETGKAILPAYEDTRFEIAQEGSDLAAQFLKNRVKVLRSEKRDLERRYRTLRKAPQSPALNEEKEALAKRIKSLEDRAKSLEKTANVKPIRNKTRHKKKQPSEAQQTLKAWNQLNTFLDYAKGKIPALKAWREDYIKASKRFEKFERDEIFLNRKLCFLNIGLGGEVERDSKEDVEALLKEAAPILKTKPDQALSKEMAEKWDQLYKRLQSIPEETLTLFIQRTEEQLEQNKWQSKHFAGRLYLSKAHTDEKVREITGQIKSFKRFIKDKMKIGGEFETLQAKIRSQEKKPPKKRELTPLESLEQELKRYHKTEKKGYKAILPGLRKERDEMKINQKQMNHKQKVFELNFWHDNGENIPRLYYGLRSYDQKSIWWQLPQAFRDELTGARLLTVCRRVLEPESKINVEKWWDKNKEGIGRHLSLIEPERLSEVYQLLPDLFKERLGGCYQWIIGADLILLSRKMEETASASPLDLRDQKRLEIWKAEKQNLEDRFSQLHPYHQQRVYDRLPREIRNLFQPFYEKHTGAYLLAYCRHHNKEISKEFRKWWASEGQNVKALWAEVGESYQRNVFSDLPLAIRDALGHK